MRQFVLLATSLVLVGLVLLAAIRFQDTAVHWLISGQLDPAVALQLSWAEKDGGRP